MGSSWSCLCGAQDHVSRGDNDDLLESRVGRNSRGQLHLLYKKGKSPQYAAFQEQDDREYQHVPTKLVVRKVDDGTHIYAVRKLLQEQRPVEMHESAPVLSQEHLASLNPNELFSPTTLAPTPNKTVPEWVVVSKELEVFVVDTGMSLHECNALVALTEQVCRGQYAAYTYAKQTLGCREFPQLARACFPAVHRITHAIQTQLSSKIKLKLDEREPHVVKYDISKKERQKLDMHTDKSEWTFLIALSDGMGSDYEGGGTYFEALGATVHVQRGHALVFPGKLRHCGQRIFKGVRFLLVGFLVDASNNHGNTIKTTTTKTRTKSSE